MIGISANLARSVVTQVLRGKPIKCARCPGRPPVDLASVEARQEVDDGMLVEIVLRHHWAHEEVRLEMSGDVLSALKFDDRRLWNTLLDQIPRSAFAKSWARCTLIRTEPGQPRRVHVE